MASDTQKSEKEDLSRFMHGTVSRDGNLYEMIRLGNSYFSKDARGYTPFRTLAEFLNFSQMWAIVDPQFSISKIRGKGYELFMATMEFEISLEFYRERKLDSFYYPMKFSTYVHSLGKSTINMVTVMRNAMNQAPLAYCFSTLIRINFKTRKSVPIPEEIMKELNVPQVKRQEGNFSDQTLPTDAFKHAVMIKISDTDFNQHMNYGAYFAFCIDALAVASSQGKLRSFDFEQAPWLVKKWKCNFAKESRAGEMLNVHLWQDDHQDDIIYFRVFREDGKPAFMCNAEFYLQDDDSAEQKLAITSYNAEFLNSIYTNASNVLLENEFQHLTRTKGNTDGITILLPAPLKYLTNPKGLLDVVTLASSAIRGSSRLNSHMGLIGSQSEGTGPMIVRVDYIFEKELYVKFKRYQLYQPTTVTSRIHSISRSAINFETKLLDHQDDSCLIKVYLKQILLNRETRKSVPNSEEIIQRFGKYYKESSPDDRVKDLPPPDGCFLYSTTVRHTQLDGNKHLNHYEYIRIILDSTVGASEAGKLKHFIGDGYNRNMKKLTVTHEKEFRYGEVVFIRVLDESGDADKLNFRVTNSDGSLAMICMIEFYEQENLKARI